MDDLTHSDFSLARSRADRATPHWCGDRTEYWLVTNVDSELPKTRQAVPMQAPVAPFTPRTPCARTGRAINRRARGRICVSKLTLCLSPKYVHAFFFSATSKVSRPVTPQQNNMISTLRPPAVLVAKSLRLEVPSKRRYRVAVDLVPCKGPHCRLR